jgi:hypothetical protein
MGVNAQGGSGCTFPISESGSVSVSNTGCHNDLQIACSFLAKRGKRCQEGGSGTGRILQFDDTARWAEVLQ